MTSQLPAPIAFAVPHPARPKTFIPPVDHAMRAMTLQSDRAARLSSAAAATAQMVAEGGVDDQAWTELWQMHRAIQDRMAELQRRWASGWFDWFAYSRQIEGANTLSKLAERENNILGQAVDLAGQQLEDVLGLMETIEVGYLYWVTQKVSPPPPRP